MIQVLRVIQAPRALLDLPEEAVVAGVLLSPVLRVIQAPRGLLDQKVLVVLRGCRVPPEFRVSRVFPDPRVILVHKALLDQLVLPVSGVLLGLLEKM